MKNDQFRFVYAADLQPGSPRSFRYRAAWHENWLAARRLIIDCAPEFMVIGGDITRDGFYHDFEFEEMRKSIDSMGIPWHAIPGNMDTGNKWTDVPGALDGRDDRLLNISGERLAAFEKFFGPVNWTFRRGALRISGFCDILLGSGLPEERKTRRFLEKLAHLPTSDNHFILMHYAPFILDPEEGDYDIASREEYFDWYFGLDRKEREYLLEIFGKSSVTRVLSAHIHCRREVRHRGIVFDFGPSTTFGQWGGKWPEGDDRPGFYLFEVVGVSVTKKFVPTAPLSTSTESFGQGGHVTRDRIDYSESRAWRAKHRARTGQSQSTKRRKSEGFQPPARPGEVSTR